MNSFKQSYKDAMEKIETPDITAETVLNEARHRKSTARRRRRQFMTAAAAACMFLLCGAGTVTAVNYINSIITVTEFGFQTADEETNRMNEELAMAGGADGGSGIEAIGEEPDAMFMGPEEEGQEVEELPQEQYGSLEEFRQARPDMKLAMPELTLLGDEIQSQHYIVLGESWVMARIALEGKYFMIDQADYNGTQGHASSTVYSSGVCNKREYTTVQEFTWQVVDSVREEGEPLRIHAATAVAGYELIVDFDGYTEQEAMYILENMDLSIYYQQ